MRKTLAVCMIFFALLQVRGLALVPGPILLSDEQVQVLQGKVPAPSPSPGHQPIPETEFRLIQATTRARAACLTAAGQRFCPGAPFAAAEALHGQVPAGLRGRVFLFAEGALLKGVLALLPVPLALPAARLGAEPVRLGPEAVSLSEIRAKFASLPVKQTFRQAFTFPSRFRSEDLGVWYYADSHLGLVTQTSAAGEFVIGAYVVK